MHRRDLRRLAAAGEYIARQGRPDASGTGGARRRADQPRASAVGGGDGVAHRAGGTGAGRRRTRLLSKTPSDPFVLRSQDRKSAVEGKSVSVRVDLGGRRVIKKKTKIVKCTRD